MGTPRLKLDQSVWIVTGSYKGSIGRVDEIIEVDNPNPPWSGIYYRLADSDLPLDSCRIEEELLADAEDWERCECMEVTTYCDVCTYPCIGRKQRRARRP